MRKAKRGAIKAGNKVSRKDRERSKQFIYRNGKRIERNSWDKYQRELKELAEEQRLKVIGLVRSKPKLLVAERKDKLEVRR